jgi:hypothetical protein
MREGTGRAREGVDRGVRRGVSARARFGTTAVTARVHRPKAVHWEELTEVGAALSPRTRRPTDRFDQREAPRPKVRRLERADTEPLEEVRGLAARADEGRASPHEGDDLEGDDLAPPPEGEDLPPADEGEDSAAEEFDRKSAPRFSPAAAARLQEALDLAQAESSLAAPPGRWFEPGQEARKILLGTRVRGIEYEGAHLNVDALSRARVLVLEEEAAISSTVDDPLLLNDARLQPDILCEKYDWTKIDDDRDVVIVVECTGAVDFFLLALSVSGSVSSATRCKGASLQTADFRAAKLISKLNEFSVEDLLEKFREHAPRQERSRHRVSDGSMYCFGMRCDARDGNTFSSYSAKEDLKADQNALIAIAYQNKMLGNIEALLLPPVGDARKRHLALADENLKQYGKHAMMIEDHPDGLDGSASPAHAFTRGYGVQLHQEMSSSLPETISWPGGQDAARELADGALCFAILDAGVLLDVGESAKGSGRVCIIPGDTWHATLRCLGVGPRRALVVAVLPDERAEHVRAEARRRRGAGQVAHVVHVLDPDGEDAGPVGPRDDGPVGRDLGRRRVAVGLQGDEVRPRLPPVRGAHADHVLAGAALGPAGRGDVGHDAAPRAGGEHGAVRLARVAAVPQRQAVGDPARVEDRVRGGWRRRRVAARVEGHEPELAAARLGRVAHAGIVALGERRRGRRVRQRVAAGARVARLDAGDLVVERAAPGRAVAHGERGAVAGAGLADDVGQLAGVDAVDVAPRRGRGGADEQGYAD